MVDGAERHRGLLRKRKRLVARVNCVINLSVVSPNGGGFACGMCTDDAVDSRKHLARPRTSASRGRQGAWWHGAATQADARVQAGADVLAESANDAPDCCACGTASNFVRADGSGCGASGGSIQAAAARRTAAATAQVTRWSRPRDRLAATKTRDGRCPEAQGCAKTVTGMPVLSKVPRLRADGSTLYIC